MNHASPPSYIGEHQRLREATRYTATVARAILERWFEFHSVIDFGCGTGNWLNCFSINTDRTILGLEMETFAPYEIEIDPGLILHLDLGLYVNLQRRFDLALCVEVAEHVDPLHAPNVVENCVRHSDVVLFSAAIPGQGGLHHVNEQLPGYWAALFEKHDYAVVDRLRPQIWDDPQIPIWYRQNLLLYVRRTSPSFDTIAVRSNEGGAGPPLALAHPDFLTFYTSEIRRLTAESDSLRQQVDEAAVALRQARGGNDQLRQMLLESRLQEARIVNSTVWRAFLMLRRRSRFIPVPVRRLLREILRALSRALRSPTIPVAREVNAALPPPDGIDLLRLEIPTYQSLGREIVFVSGESHTPGHEYRVLRYAKAAAAIGATVHWLTLEDYENHRASLYRAGVVVLWRVANSPAAAAVIEMARQSSARILFDTDDLVFRPEIANVKVIDGIRSQKLSESLTADLYTRFREVLDQTDACFCSTVELADQIRAIGKVAYVLPNGFDHDSFAAARHAMRQWRATRQDKLIRIGYASGTLTHQRDFAVAAESLARILAERDDCRLVLFRRPGPGDTLLNVDEFSCFSRVTEQIEWREMVSLAELPYELARFDINLAPLEVGNVYCEAKSELKFFEAALVNVCTIASPTGPMARAIRHDETGLLAANPEDWYHMVSRLVDQPETRERLSRAAFLDVLGRYGPNRQQNELAFGLQELENGPRGAQALQLRLLLERQPPAEPPAIPPSTVLFSSDALRVSEVTVVIPLYNYGKYIIDALDSVRRQTLHDLDVIVIDDASTDNSAELAVNWMREHAARFNRTLVLRNTANAGLALTRNVGFDAAETAFVLPLDADNRLRPRCCEVCLTVLRQSSAGFAYPSIQQFGDASWLMGVDDFLPSRFVGGNYVDAMALVGKWAWVGVGGYANIKYGWEDYDFWCRCVERGIGGVHVPAVLAEYRVHRKSMLRTQTDVAGNKEQVMAILEQKHPWLRIVPPPPP
jgi:glycosyltransferase involved in cell wall biosynthesis